MIGFVRVFVRTLLLIAITFICVAIALIISIIQGQKAYQTTIKISKWWAGRMMRVMGIKVHYKGQVPEENVLILPNHRSYIDILLLPQLFTCTFVAKAEVRKWPGIGLGGKLVAVIFVNRKSKESRKKTRELIRDRFDKGISVVVFPEGTTTTGPKVKELRNGIFQVAVGGPLPVMPVAIEYQNQGDAWVGDDKFIPHFLKTFRRRCTHVSVRFGEVRKSEDWESLRYEVYDWLNDNLIEMREAYDEAKLVNI